MDVLSAAGLTVEDIDPQYLSFGDSADGLKDGKIDAAFIVPYVFALNPAMLFIDTSVWEVIQICITSFVGIFAVSAALEGYFLCHMSWYQRILSAAGGLLLIYPGLITDTVGLCLVAIVVVMQLYGQKKVKSLS